MLDDIRPPGGSYDLREQLLHPSPRDWRCSYPAALAPGPFGCGHGPINATAEPYARGRDFGNWFPARLTVRKELDPPDDPGRFDLLVNDTVFLPAAGDGATRTEQIDPGSYSFSEVAVPPTDASAYASTTDCKRSPRRRRQAPGTSFGPLHGAGRR